MSKIKVVSENCSQKKIYLEIHAYSDSIILKENPSMKKKQI